MDPVPSRPAEPGFATHPAFETWPDDAIRALNQAVSVVECPAGEVLYLAGDIAKGVFLLRQGEVELLMPGPNGQQLVSHRVRAGGTIGLGPVVAGRAYEFTARASRKVTALFVPRAAFMEILAEFPRATISVSHALSSEVAMAYRRLVSLRQT